MNTETTLRLTIKKKWFDMIASGEKKEEYREIKRYWVSRLCEQFFHGIENGLEVIYDKETGLADLVLNLKTKDFKYVEFTNGYSKESPKITAEFKCIEVGEAKPEWSDNWKGKVFIISLGSIIH